MTHILLVDDDASILQAYDLLLGLAGHTVVTATDGAHALCVLAGRLNVHDLGTDLLITDLRMPRLNGLGLIREIRQSPVPAIRDIPAILMTGEFSAETQRAGIIAGADLVLPKPCEEDLLLTAINRLLGP